MQLSGVLSDTEEFVLVTVPPPVLKTPPPADPAWLLLTDEDVRLTEPPK